MNPDRWIEIDRIFEEALELHPRERREFLNRQCRDDAILRRDVEALIRSHEDAGNPMLHSLQSGFFEAGARFGNYDILGLAGSGRLGQVWRARDFRLRREAALTLLPLSLTTDSERVDGLKQRVRVLKELRHPHVAVTHGLENVAGRWILIREFVDGPTLQDRIRQHPLSLDDALGYARRIAAALEAAHLQGIAHNDLKPSNIVLEGPEALKVSGFSLLEWNKSEDIRAFGRVLFEMLTGRPWQRDLQLSIDGPPPIQRLLRRCLGVEEPVLKDMGEVRLEIERVQESTSAEQPAGKWRLIALAIALLFLVVALLKLSGVW